MLDGLHLEIEGFGLINEANIEIGKINVVGGVNASGKSTASKVLYCFLKAMSLNRQEYIFKTILPKFNKFINIMEAPNRHGEILNPDKKFSVEDDIHEMVEEYTKAKEAYDSLGNSYFESPFDDYMTDLVQHLEKFLPILLNKDNKAYSPIVRLLFSSEFLLDFEGKSDFYNDSFRCSVSYEDTEFKGFRSEREYGLKSKNLSYDDFDDGFIYSTEGDVDFMNDVFYIDSISTFDFYNSYGIKGHLNDLLDDLKDDDGTTSIFDFDGGRFHQQRIETKSQLSEDMIQAMDCLNERISEIVGGKIIRHHQYIFNDKGFGKEIFHFEPLNSGDSFKLNISSGIQQITILQKLLANYRLQPGSFLIIDEPEVNLHPKWQFKFAEILVLLAKELDIAIYLNSHSPIFIESINAFSEYYDMEGDVNYYLTEESEAEGKYDFKKIPSNRLYKIYNNLGNVYDEIDKLRLEKRLGD